MKSLSILIPIYNEEESLQALFDELKLSFENIKFKNDATTTSKTSDLSKDHAWTAGQLRHV